MCLPYEAQHPREGTMSIQGFLKFKTSVTSPLKSLNGKSGTITARCCRGMSYGVNIASGR